VDYRNLFRKLEENLAQIERTDDVVSLLSAILEHVVEDFNEDLGLEGGRLFVRRDDLLVLEAEYPASANRLGYEVPVSYQPVQELLRRGFVLHDPGDPGLDSRIESELGVRTFAAIQVGESRQQIMAFSLRDSSDREHVIYMLNTIRHAINLKLRKQHLEDRVAEARAIQMSLLPAAAPRFHDFDIWGDSSPAEEVGGDLYDYIVVSERSLGVAIADSAGHGLPAALQARDAIVGLRMGVEERMRITATMEKLNRVVSRSALATRFISLFYGEIEPNGNLVYCNAGHNPPLLLREGEITELRHGGLILGPNPDAQYERGYTLISPGSVLLLYTDGIIEAADDETGEMFGLERLREILTSSEWGSARDLVEKVFAEVVAFSRTDPPHDDQTVVAVIRRKEAS
jgi:sigma-B regulation protein RsbU (phosphoserine phosphatase)